MNILHHELSTFFSGRWWIDGSYQRRLLQAMRHVQHLSAETVATAKAAYTQDTPTPTIVGDVAVIEAKGAITYRSSWLTRYLGWTTIDDLQAQFAAAFADPNVRTIIMRCDSPGGVSDMVKEFSEWLFTEKTRAGKTVIAVADLMMCSAMYWIAAQADLIYATDSSQIGSIGVYMLHEDDSKWLEDMGIKLTFISYGAHKVEGNSFEPLSDDARARLQEMVNEVGAWFDAAVARGRKVSKKQVADSFGQGKVFSGPEAIALGLADKKGTFAQVIGKVAKLRTPDGSRTRAAMLQVLASADDADECIEPDEHGECPEGHELRDGMCYRTDGTAQADAPMDDAQADVDAAAAAVAIAERR